MSSTTFWLVFVYICCVYSFNEDLDFSFDLHEKTIHQLSEHQLIVIASNDDRTKYLFFTVAPSSLQNAGFLNFSLAGILDGSFSIHRLDGERLCSVGHDNGLCLMHVEKQNAGLYYMAYYGTLDMDLSFTIVENWEWHVIPYLHTDAPPPLPANGDRFEQITVGEKTYLFVLGNFDVAYIWDHDHSQSEPNRKQWTEIEIHSNDGEIDISSARTSLVAMENRFIYLFASADRFMIYKFDTVVNRFVDNDISSTDEEYKFSCVAYNEQKHKIYFIGSDSHPLLIYDFGQSKWFFGPAINVVVSRCATFSVDDDNDMVLAIDTDNHNIWSYDARLALWHLSPLKLSVDAVHIASDTVNNLLYVMDAYGHIQSIQILNETDIRCHNEENLILNNPNDAVLMTTFVSEFAELMVWTKFTVQSNQNWYGEPDPDDHETSNDALYDYVTMIMAGLSYISVGLILITCQKKIHSKYKLPVNDNLI